MTVFFDDEDRQTYLDVLSLYSQKNSLQIWAYCLMDNHLHLVAVPENEYSLAKGVGLTNQVYTQYLNRKLGQSGRVWQNRFFSCIVENNQYLWAVARYVECNPVKAGLVRGAKEYQWSSAKAHLSGVNNPLLHEPAWLDPTEQKAYVAYVKNSDTETDNAIIKATKTGRPFGTETFIDEMEFSLNRSLRPKRPGRPRKG
jgi:putative transposase